MRFSSDDQIFDENSKNQQADQSQDPKQSPLKKEKKQTMLSKFLDSLDVNTIKKLQNYQKLKRPVFQRRPIVPQKISLYEDVLFILAFKDHRQNINKDGKQLKEICNDLESRTKRKQCTIKQRIQKKLCKMSPKELLDHVANDKDISFNLKKVLTSGAKIESQKSPHKQNSENLENTPKKQQNSEQQQKMEIQQHEKTSLNSKDSTSKKSQLFEEKENEQNVQQEKLNEKDQNSSEQIPCDMENIDESQILIVFQKNQDGVNLFMINRLIVEREIKKLKKKEEEAKQREELLNKLKSQMDVIMQFRNKFSTIPHEVQMLIDEAKKIMQVLEIGPLDQIQNIQNQNIAAKKSQTKNENQATADRMQSETPQAPNEEKMMQNEVTEFNIQEEKSETQDKNEKQSNEKTENNEAPKYSISFALCENSEYIKLYYTNPQVFEPLLWTWDEDMLIEKLIEDFDSNEGMFNLLVRYKGPDMFIERCMFQKKAITEGKLLDAIRNFKPLNMGKLINYINYLNDKNKEDNPRLMTEAVWNNQIVIE